MIGQYAFEQIVAFADKDERPSVLISQEDYDVWQKDVIWDNLHGIRYGQSFCNRFGITDHLLYYTTWPIVQQNDYIKKHYVDRSRI